MPAKLKPGALDVLAKSNVALREKQEAANSTLSTYAKRVVKMRDKVMVVPPTEDGGMYTLQLSQDCRMTEDEGNGSLKALPSDKGNVGQALNLHNSTRLGVPADSNFPVVDHEGKVIAIMYCKVIPTEALPGWKLLEEDFDFNSKGWTRGCEAAAVPDLELMKAQLRDCWHATQSGVADHMVVESVGPKTEGSTKCFMERYRNTSGRLIACAMGSWINRRKMKNRQWKDLVAATGCSYPPSGKHFQCDDGSFSRCSATIPELPWLSCSEN